ncbi:hypothetical protein M9Y10_001720 [Tritrichomonas musculus]|uniref:Mediator of RNA polymerase II transcription subunit 11 n=1 Tax=Tritrichomonas musculus TaxID=1915356 RepID=A0ABR2L7V9_9EUKA
MSVNSDNIKDLQNRTDEAISTLALEFQKIMKDATIAIDNPLKSSIQKLDLDIHTMKIDQSARQLLYIIRLIKEIKVADDSNQQDRAQYEIQCKEATKRVKECVRLSYNQLTDLAEEGFAVRQAASKFLH